MPAATKETRVAVSETSRATSGLKPQAPLHRLVQDGAEVARVGDEGLVLEVGDVDRVLLCEPVRLREDGDQRLGQDGLDDQPGLAHRRPQQTEVERAVLEPADLGGREGRRRRPRGSGVPAATAPPTRARARRGASCGGTA